MSVRLAAVRGAIAAFGLGIAALPSVSVAVGEVEAIGRYRDWRVYTERVDGDLVCFAATPAEDMAPKSLDHGEVNFIVANWRSGAGRNQPSLEVGYDLRPDIAARAIVGRERYPMYVSGNEAFARDEHESDLVRALKRGSELRVEAAEQGTRTAYYFSLLGSTDAIERAQALCR